ncbi:hypothetical protein Tco_1013102 [Tanacetum coccineum]
MSITKEQQQALDDALVPREQRLRISKFHYQPLHVKSSIRHYHEENHGRLAQANDVPTLSTMRFFTKHETVQKYGAIILDTLTNQAKKESDAYNTYHDFSTGKVIPKPKYIRRSTREKTDQAPTASPGKRLKAITKKSNDEDDDDEVSLSKDDDDNDDDDGQDDDNEQTESDNDAYDEVTQGDNVEGEELDEEETNEEEKVNELYRDVNVNLERRDTKMTDAL